jgi:hypothetical protein
MKRLVRKAENGLEAAKTGIANDLGCSASKIDTSENMIRATLDFDEVVSKVAPSLFSSEDKKIIKDCTDATLGTNEITIMVKQGDVEAGLDAENVEDAENIEATKNIKESTIEKLVEKVAEFQHTIEEILRKNTSDIF